MGTMIGIQISAQVALQVYRNIAICSSRTDPELFLQSMDMQFVEVQYRMSCNP